MLLNPSAYLLDTNLLLRIADPASDTHNIAATAIENLTSTGATLFVTPQNILEFWNSATRPSANNGLGWTPAVAASQITNIQATYALLPDNANIFPEWERLATTYSIQGLQVYDTRLAAVALTYRIANVLTFNFKHFRRFSPEGLNVVDPAMVTPPPKLSI